MVFKTSYGIRGWVQSIKDKVKVKQTEWTEKELSSRKKPICKKDSGLRTSVVSWIRQQLFKKGHLINGTLSRFSARANLIYLSSENNRSVTLSRHADQSSMR